MRPWLRKQAKNLKKLRIQQAKQTAASNNLESSITEHSDTPSKVPLDPSPECSESSTPPTQFNPSKLCVADRESRGEISSTSSGRRLSCVSSPIGNPNSPLCQPLTFFDLEVTRLGFEETTKAHKKQWRVISNEHVLGSNTYPDKL